ncbi:SDR family oxidoreductase [Curtobacterium sp. MCBD17_026]|uniref:SDR family oxidoreductase n=1 Tax=Curtobacterium sp. MCBD17_026 TaxID=2175621 RepID=UPI000DA9DC4E|nr:SDR family oxidoreductase [Curtobacterium sp. MCBD17_026]WIB72557.1 SDR family oxidoreductase [Curtobacterium sp. MCBD17_026]
MEHRLHGSVVLVTGANGGFGTEFVTQALERGAARVYAAARTPREWDDARVISLALDVTDRESVERARRIASDVTMVVNNAGTASRASLLTGDESELRGVVETNLWGTLAVARAFAPQLVAAHGVLLNVLSSTSWSGRIGAYSTSKAALMSATNAIRLELDGHGVLVIGLYAGWVRTPMTAGLQVDMIEPDVVIRAAYDGIERGDYEVLVDDFSRRSKSRASLPIAEAYPELHVSTAP